jgi:hypothetical protein
MKYIIFKQNICVRFSLSDNKRVLERVVVVVMLTQTREKVGNIYMPKPNQ